MTAAAALCVSSVDLANAGHCSIYSLAADQGVTLIPTAGGPAAWLLGKSCYYNARATLGAQAAAVCGALALDKCPTDAASRGLMRSLMLARCLETLGDLAARPLGSLLMR